MNEFQQSWCAKLLEKLLKKETAQKFRENVHKTGSFDHPVTALKTVEETLKEQRYKTILDFISAVRDVWYNAMSSSKPDSTTHLMAEDLSIWFERKIKNYPRTAEEQWIMKLRKCQEKLNILIKTPIPTKQILSYPKEKESA